MAFCAHVIYSTEDLLIVNDATKDLRFMHNPLVTGSPNIRFYAGAPLVTPEGHKIGTLCIIDTKPRDGLSLSEKQNLTELAALTMESIHQRREDFERNEAHTNKIIACTAHDLLTPLSGVELNLSLLMDDEKIWKVMDESERELMRSAYSCSEIMRRICRQAIATFRASSSTSNSNGSTMESTIKNGMGNSDVPVSPTVANSELEKHAMEVRGNYSIVVIAQFMENIGLLLGSFSKTIPLSFHVDNDVPPKIITDEIKIFRSLMNFLTNAYNNTKTGSIRVRLRMSKTKRVSLGQLSITDEIPTTEEIVFACEDTGPLVAHTEIVKGFTDKLNSFSGKLSRADYSSDETTLDTGLGLTSVVNNIRSLRGKYGYFISNNQKDSSFTSIPDLKAPDTADINVFWFSIPFCVPPTENAKIRDTRERQSSFDLKRRNSLSSRTESVDLKKRNSVSCRTKSFDLKRRPSLSSRTESIDSDTQRQSKSFRNKNVTVSDLDSIGSANTQADGETIVDFAKNAKRLLRAIIIDDSLTIRKSIDRALTRLGFTVTQAVNGMEGLEKMQSCIFEICFCDFLMPVMDGLDCVEQYRAWEIQHRPWLRMYIIGISAHASQEDANKGLSVGMDKFFTKPIQLKVLKEIARSDEVTAISRELDARHEESIKALVSTQHVIK